MKESSNTELEYYLTLERIAKAYDSATRIIKTAESRYGISPEEALQMAYENIQNDARNAIKGRHRPTLKLVALEHGKTCDKVPHERTGMLHDADDDKPFDVDGVNYCGRCHVAL